VEVIFRYILESKFTGRACLKVHCISWCQGLLVEGVLRYIMVSMFTGGGYLEIYHGIKIY
jgi:hypothetical protein